MINTFKKLTPPYHDNYGHTITFKNWVPNSTQYANWFVYFIKYNDVKLSSDLTFYSVFGKKEDILEDISINDKSSKNVFFSPKDIENRLFCGEDYRDYLQNNVDLSLSFSNNQTNKCLRFPRWLITTFAPICNKEWIVSRVLDINEAINKQEYTCINVSQHDVNNTRRPIADRLKNVLKIRFAGRWNNNTNILYSDYHNDKIELLKDSKFTLCIESYNTRFYTTESLFDAFIAGSIPIYAGADNMPEYGLVNHDAIIIWRIGEDNDELINRIKELNTSQQAYDEYIKQIRLYPVMIEYVYNTFFALKYKLEHL